MIVLWPTPVLILGDTVDATCRVPVGGECLRKTQLPYSFWVLKIHSIRMHPFVW